MVARLTFYENALVGPERCPLCSSTAVITSCPYKTKEGIRKVGFDYIYFSYFRQKSSIVTGVSYLSIPLGKFAFEGTVLCWDTGKIMKKLTPALRPAAGSIVGESFMT